MNPKDLTKDDVSRETRERLEEFEALLLKWNSKINLIAKSDADRIWPRHIADSIQVYQHVKQPYASWYDFGSGGGFPGIVCAMLCHEHAPDVVFYLVESDSRKAVFLRQAASTLGLSINVLSQRIESLKSSVADVITARALAPLPELLRLCAPHIGQGTQLLFPKGRKAEAELTQAVQSWEMEVERIPSLTDPDATIIRLTGVRLRQ